MPEQGVKGVVGLRRRLVERKQTRQAMWLATLIVLAGGLALALEGVWGGAVPVLALGGALAWLAGAFVAPWGGDAYVRRLGRTWRNWATDTRLAYEQFAVRQAEFAQKLRYLSPPPECAGDHQRLVSLVEEHEQLRRRRGASPTEMTRAQERIRALEDELADRSAAAGDRRYGDGLRELFAERREQYAVAARASERAAQDAVRRVEGIKPPASVAAEHARLVAGFRNHLDVARALHAAAQAADVTEVVAAAEAWTKSVSAMRETLQRVAVELDYYERWPAPPPPTGLADGT